MGWFAVCSVVRRTRIIEPCLTAALLFTSLSNNERCRFRADVTKELLPFGHQSGFNFNAFKHSNSFSIIHALSSLSNCPIHAIKTFLAFCSLSSSLHDFPTSLNCDTDLPLYFMWCIFADRTMAILTVFRHHAFTLVLNAKTLEWKSFNSSSDDPGLINCLNSLQVGGFCPNNVSAIYVVWLRSTLCFHQAIEILNMF